MLSHGVIFNLCSATIIDTYFSYDRGIWIAVTDYYVYFYLILLFVLIYILQLLNFTAS